jgi:uncharacterized protein
MSKQTTKMATRPEDTITHCLYDISIPMRDGVKLSANIYFPPGKSGKFPTLLNVTPYGKDSMRRTAVRSMIRYFASQGYAVTHVDVRGRGNSEGEFTPFFQEIDDGHDTIEWLGKQSWSTGKIGTFGRSYGGCAQLYPLRHGSKYQKAAFVMCSPSIHPFHDCTAYTSGTYMPIMISWAMLLTGKTLKNEIYDPEIDWEPLMGVRPLKDTAMRLGLAKDPLEIYEKHETYDDYFKNVWSDEMIALMNVPCYFVSGWYDDSLQGALDHFPALTHDNPDPDSRRNHKLLLGPWPHALSAPFHNSGKLGDFDYGPQSVVPLQKEAIKWFDYWLKGIDNGIVSEPPVRLFLMGENRWMNAKEFPLSNSAKTSLYLSADGPANTLAGRGNLEWEMRDGKSLQSTFTYDPANPAPSPFAKEGFQNGMNEDLRSIQRRDDILVFSTSELTGPVNVIGMVNAELFVSTTAVDTDFVARLSDVHPNGYAQRMCQGILRVRYRQGYEKMVPVIPGEVMKIPISMMGTGQQFQNGHRIRLEVTSSAFPSAAPNYNTGKSAWEENDPIVAEQTVYHSSRYPSRLIIPVVKEPKFSDTWTESRWT